MLGKSRWSLAAESLGEMMAIDFFFILEITNHTNAGEAYTNRVSR